MAPNIFAEMRTINNCRVGRAYPIETETAQFEDPATKLLNTLEGLRVEKQSEKLLRRNRYLQRRVIELEAKLADARAQNLSLRTREVSNVR